MRTGADLAAIRERKPLVHQITNYVVMNETANATLALGALPVMLLWWARAGVFPAWNLLSVGLYIVLAGGAAIVRFRFGRRLW